MTSQSHNNHQTGTPQHRSEGSPRHHPETQPANHHDGHGRPSTTTPTNLAATHQFQVNGTQKQPNHPTAKQRKHITGVPDGNGLAAAQNGSSPASRSTPRWKPPRASSSTGSAPTGSNSPNGTPTCSASPLRLSWPSSTTRTSPSTTSSAAPTRTRPPRCAAGGPGGPEPGPARRPRNGSGGGRRDSARNGNRPPTGARTATPRCGTAGSTSAWNVTAPSPWKRS